MHDPFDRSALLERLDSEPDIDLDPLDDSAVDPPLDVGQRVGDYVVEGEIGAGACGRVYRGRHPVLGRQAAIKVLHRRWSVDPAMVARFVAEARAVNRVRHPGIVDIYAFGSLADGQQYCVMELLEGQTLDALIESRGQLRLDEALPLLRSIAEALGAAHEAGIAHRDLKPANVFVTPDARAPGGLKPTLLDFGMAKLIDDGDANSSGVTRTGAAVGTPAYMAPEQCLGRAVDARADVYAFGLVAWMMFAGRHPFEADSAFEMMAAQIGEPPPDLHKTVPGLPRGVDAAVRRALAKQPEDRPATALAVVQQLEAAARGEVGAGGWWRWAAAAALVATLGAVVWWTTAGPGDATPAADLEPAVSTGIPAAPAEPSPAPPVAPPAPAPAPAEADPVEPAVPPEPVAEVSPTPKAPDPAPADAPDPPARPAPTPEAAATPKADTPAAPTPKADPPQPPAEEAAAPTAPARPRDADPAPQPRAPEKKPAAEEPSSRGLHDLEPWD